MNVEFKPGSTTFNLDFKQGGTSFSSYKGSSPVNIGLEQADDGVVITVTDSGGTESAKIKDGVSVTHEWDGTTLNVTSASGTSSADLKGDDGVGIESIAQTTWSYADEGENIITVKTTDGKTDIFKIRNGSRGSQGERGPQGFQGLTGPAGPQGIQGIQGPRGIPGERGPQGERGATGARGETGPAGPAGTAGVDGKDGRRGTTTYRITTKPTQRYVENNDFTSYYIISREAVANEAGTNDFMIGDTLMHESSLYPIVSTGPTDLFLDDLTDLRGERGYTGLPGERGPQGEPGEPGEAGQRGAGIYRISTTPNIASHYSTEKIRYSIKLETAASEAGVDSIMVGDSLLRGSLLYPVLYTDLVYAYLGEYVSLKGEPGTGGDGGGGAVLVVDTRSDSQEKSMTFAEALALIESGQSLMAYDTYQHQAYVLQHWSDEKIVFVGRVTEYIMAESGVHRKLTYYNDNTLSVEKMNDDAISYGILTVNEDGDLVCDRTYMGLLNDDFSFGKVIALLRVTDEKVVVYYFYKMVADESTGGVMSLFGTPEGERIGFCDDESIVELPAVSGGGGVSNWEDLEGKPNVFPPAKHTHVWEDIEGDNDFLTTEDLYGFMEKLDAGFLKFITITGGTQEIVESRYTDVTVIKIVGATLSHSFEEIAAMDSMGLMPVIGMGGMWLMPSVTNAIVMTNYGTDANRAHVFTNICQFGAIDTSPRSEAHILDNGEIYVYIGMSGVASTDYVRNAIEAALTEGGGGGVSFITDETLTLENGILSVNTADAAEADNTLPITSAAVATQVGNIEILLATI